MKLNRRDIRRLISEVLNEEDNSASMDVQNRELEDAMYEYLERFAQAPEDEELLNSKYFGHRRNPETQGDRAAMGILNNKSSDIGLKIGGRLNPESDDRDVQYVFCFFHIRRFIEPFFGDTPVSSKDAGGMFAAAEATVAKHRRNIDKMIEYAKKVTGHTDVEIKLGFTSNTRRYDDASNDNSVLTVNRMN